MKRIFLILFFLAAVFSVAGQKKGKGYFNATLEVSPAGDTLEVLHLMPVYVFDKKADLRKYQRLGAAVIKVYPVAQLARQRLREMEAELTRLPDAKSQQEYTKSLAKQIEREYTPVLKKMTVTEGRVLLKLIDRQTEKTAYAILREFRGGFVAGFWQSVGRLFGHNLKSEYDPEEEDRVLEQIVVYYEAGLL